MSLARRRLPVVLVVLGLAAALFMALLSPIGASSHREAPLITEDPVADNTDVYAWMKGENMVVVANWIPLEEPAGGPNFFKFGDDVLYEINIDNDGDAKDDVVYEFRFTTKIKNPNTFLYNTGPIETLDDADWNMVQTYTVSEVKNGRRTKLGSGLFSPPNNIGPRSTPNYENLAAQAVYSLPGGIKVFAGQRDEVFPVDLGSIFDLGGLRPLNNFHLLPLDAESGIDATTGYNVHSIVMEIPASRLVDDDPVLGVYSTTYRRQTRVFAFGDGSKPFHLGDWVQVSRLGMPLVNEVVIPLGKKDRFNASEPRDDAQFLNFVVDPELGRLIPALYGSSGIQVPQAPRNDLVTIFLTGIPGINQPKNVKPSEMLRINTTLPSGFPNGRTLQDDIVDTSLQAVAGVFCDSDSGDPADGCAGASFDSPFNVFPNNALNDGATGNDRPFLTGFPYMPTPHQGYDHVHDHTNSDA